MIEPATIERFAPRFEYAFSIALTLTPVRWVSPSTMGATRGAVYAAQGSIEGPALNGRVVPMSGGPGPACQGGQGLAARSQTVAPTGVLIDRLAEPA